MTAEKRAYNKAYYAKNRSKILAKMRETTFGITQEQFDAMAAAQDYRCAVCGTDDPGAGRGWQVDHDHTSGAVRGLLCLGCNVGLGHFKDNIEALSGAISYLQRHNVR